MKVLVGFEESQSVTIALRSKGIEAYSCDLQECSGDKPEWHLQMDIFQALQLHKWDALIAFPPCTHLAVSGAAWFKKKQEDGRQQQGIDLFMAMVNQSIDYIAIENPIGIMSRLYRKPDQIIHPYYFGDPEPKATCLWLKGFPRLVHAKQNNLFDQKTHVEPEYITASNGKKYSRIHWLGGGSGKERSKTYSGIANAMAEQWGRFLLDRLK